MIPADLTDIEKEIIKKYRQLDDEKRARFERMTDALLFAQENKTATAKERLMALAIDMASVGDEAGYKIVTDVIKDLPG